MSLFVIKKRKKIELLALLSLSTMLVLSCSDSGSNDDTGGGTSKNNKLSGSYVAVLAGSSGHSTFTLDDSDVSKNKISLTFDKDQDGTDDIVIVKTGKDVGDLSKGVTYPHAQGDVTVTATETDGTPKLTVKVKDHKEVTVLVEKSGGDKLEIYRGETGEREAVFMRTADGKGTVDIKATAAIKDLVYLNRVVFNAIFNTDKKTFKYIVKGIEVDLGKESGETLTDAQKQKIRDELAPHVDTVAEGTYTDSADGKTRTITFSDKKTETFALQDDGTMTNFHFSGMLCKGRSIKATDASGALSGALSGILSGALSSVSSALPALPLAFVKASQKSKLQYKKTGKVVDVASFNCPTGRTYVDGLEVMQGEFVSTGKVVGDPYASSYVYEPVSGTKTSNVNLPFKANAGNKAIAAYTILKPSKK